MGFVNHQQQGFFPWKAGGGHSGKCSFRETTPGATGIFGEDVGNEKSNEKRDPGCLGYIIGEYTTLLYRELNKPL